MKYWTYTTLLVGVLLFGGSGCDNDKKQQSDDAGADTGASSAKSAEQKQKEKGGESDDQSDKRPEAKSKESATINEKPPLQIDSYLTREDVTKIAGIEKGESTDLPGRDPSPTYNARRIAPAEGGDYGAGLQVWAFENSEAAQKRLSEFRSQYLNVKEPAEELVEIVGEGAFNSKRGGIRNLVFKTEDPPRIVAVSCSIETCDSTEQLHKLAEQVRERMTESEK